MAFLYDNLTTFKLWAGQKLRLALREAIFHRFAQKTQQAKNSEFLTDNGPEFISDQLQELFGRLGLIARRTPCHSPQSNGLVESFFGSFKRDYLSYQLWKLWPRP